MQISIRNKRRKTLARPAVFGENEAPDTAEPRPADKPKLRFLPSQARSPPEHSDAEPDAATADESSGEEDYMKMVIPDLPKQTDLDVTYSELRKRKLREQEVKSRTRAPQIVQREKLELGLSQSLIEDDSDGGGGGSSSVALSIMKKMGFVPGQGLGKSAENAISDPLRPVLKYGIGMDEANRQELQQQQERAKAQEEEQHSSFLDRIRDEQLEKKLNTQLRAAQKVCQELDVASDPRLESTLFSHTTSVSTDALDVPTLNSINFLWRDLVIERETAEYERRLRKQILDRPTRLDEYDSPSPGRSRLEEFVPSDYDDDELTNFNALEPAQKLQVVLEYLRHKYRYCFWCGCKYDDDDDLNENCPGINEEDHE